MHEEELWVRLNRLENKVDFLFQELGLQEKYLAGQPQNPQDAVLESAMAEIMALLRMNRKIEAIKLYRQMTGLGLKEAKDAIDNMERMM